MEAGEAQCMQDLVFGHGKRKVCVFILHALAEVDGSSDGPVLQCLTLARGGHSHGGGTTPSTLGAEGCVCRDVQDKVVATDSSTIFCWAANSATKTGNATPAFPTLLYR